MSLKTLLKLLSQQYLSSLKNIKCSEGEERERGRENIQVHLINTGNKTNVIKDVWTDVEEQYQIYPAGQRMLEMELPGKKKRERLQGRVGDVVKEDVEIVV